MTTVKILLIIRGSLVPCPTDAGQAEIPTGPTQNQEVTTSKIVTFLLAPVWRQDLGENEEFSFKLS